MTNPTPPPSPTGSDPGPAREGPEGPRVTRHDVFDLGRLRRETSDSRIAGVASGLARHLDIDPIIVRVALVVLVFFGGAGLLLYIACWILIPEAGTNSQPLGLDDRNRSIALIGVGVLAALAAVGDWAGAFWFPWPVVIVALLIAWFFTRRERGPQMYAGPGTAPPAMYSGPPPATQAMYAPPPPNSPAYPPAYAPQPYVRPNPRRRGPILFWAALALIAVAIGTLGIIDVAGTIVPFPAYPALALAVTGAVLVLGAFWGRAGGLIFLGLSLGALTLASTGVTHLDSDRTTIAPTRADSVATSYDLGAGELVLDLSGVTDVEGLDGRVIAVDGGVGSVEVIVPAGVNVSVDATAGAGRLEVFGQESAGLDVTHHNVIDNGDDLPAIRLDLDLGLGQVIVREQ